MRAFSFGLLLGLSLLIAAAGCDDDAPGNHADAGSDAAIDAAVDTPCTEDSECDDGLLCTGVESCTDGVCRAGTAIECDDGIACTVDRCSERAQGCESLPPDSDGDGHFSAGCQDASGKPLGDDCDDEDPLRFPGNIEFCDPDHHDEDCDPQTFGERDADDDGSLDALCCNAESDTTSAALICGDDCDDQKASVHPGAVEVCDLYDNDCDDETDEGVTIAQYPDADFDLHGKAGSKAVMMCPGQPGFSGLADDCHDQDPEVFTGQFEICDGKDNDCDDKIDEVQEDAPWFLDVDGDGFGDGDSPPVYSCERVPGRVLSSSDCRDDNPAIHPAAAELCDGIDNDCSGKKEFRLGVNDFEDDDNDGIADDACEGGSDCNDKDPATAAGKDEVCDRIDNDCDDVIDEMTAQTVWFLDMDGDGWGVRRGTALTRCEPIPGRTANLGDCDDSRNDANPNAPETCNGKDDDCDGDIDEATDSQCSLANALSTCKAGACAILSCYSGHGDCNTVAADGCECSADVVPLPGQTSSCFSDAVCQDGDYCNGHERCNPVDQLCYAGTPVNCTVTASLLQGDVFVMNSLDIAALAGIETITGNLTISATGLSNLTGLESLHAIGGDLIVDGDADDDGTLDGNQSLQALVGSGLSNLVSVGGVIRIEDNLVLGAVRLPSLVTAGGLVVRNNPAVTQLAGFTHLVKLEGSLIVANNDKLTGLSLPVLTRVSGALYIHGNARLDDPEAPLLGRLGAGPDDSGLDLWDNAALRSLSRFGAAMLSCDNGFCSAQVHENPLLCSPTVLTDRLRDFQSFAIRGNRIAGCADTAVMNGPHIRTFDGAAYTFNGVGELTLIKSTTDDLEVQVRTAQFGNRLDTAVAVAVAARVGDDRITFYRGESSPRINGTLTALNPGWFTLPGGGAIERIGDDFIVSWPDGSLIRMRAGSSLITVEAALSQTRRGQVEGLFSNWNGNTNNELVTRDGIALANDPPFYTFYDLFVESWRITQATSLFDYFDGSQTDSFTNRNFPLSVPTLPNLDPTARAMAAAVCSNAGVTIPYWLDACTLDVALLGDSTLADGFAPLPAVTVAVPAPQPPTTSSLGTFPPFTMDDPTDETPLGVVQTLPTGGSTLVDTRSTVVIYFDDELNPASLTDDNLAVTVDGVKVFGLFSANLSSTGNTILFLQPYRELPESTLISISIPAGGLRDDNDNAIANTYDFSFTTAATSTVPPEDLSYESPIGWSFGGDAAIVTSPQGDIVAQHQSHMAVITSQALFGGAANDDTTSTLTSGPISVPAGKTHVRFEYDFVSEEFDQYVGQNYDDFFSVSISGPSGTTSIAVASVNSVGVDGSTPVNVPGMSAEHSGWLTADIDIAALGSPITLSFNVSDVGDTALASAAFIDNIRFP